MKRRKQTKRGIKCVFPSRDRRAVRRQRLLPLVVLRGRGPALRTRLPRR